MSQLHPKAAPENEIFLVFFPDPREFGDEFAADCLHRQIKDLGKAVIRESVAKSRFANHLLISVCGTRLTALTPPSRERSFLGGHDRCVTTCRVLTTTSTGSADDGCGQYYQRRAYLHGWRVSAFWPLEMLVHPPLPALRSFCRSPLSRSAVVPNSHSGNLPTYCCLRREGRFSSCLQLMQ